MFSQFFKRLTGKFNKRPGSHLRIAVFSEHEGRERMMINPRLLRNSTNQTRRIKTCTCTHNLVRRQSALFANQMSNNIARISNINEIAVKSTLHNLGNIIGYTRYSKSHFIITTARRTQFNLAHGINDNVAITQFFILCNHIIYMMRHEKDGIHQILTFADSLLFIYIANFNYIGGTSHAQHKSYMSTYMTHSDYTDNSFFHDKSP